MRNKRPYKRRVLDKDPAATCVSRLYDGYRQYVVVFSADGDNPAWDFFAYSAKRAWARAYDRVLAVPSLARKPV